jgi:hypothetical protein
MGRTFANISATRVDRAGYYFNERLCKLARLQEGEKLPNRVGPWEYLAGNHELSSSQVVQKLLQQRPGLDINDLTYTVRSPLNRRFLLGEPPRTRRLKAFALATGMLALGFWLGRQAA